jgi:hypothetical protein
LGGEFDPEVDSPELDEADSKISKKALPTGCVSKACEIGMTGFEPATSTSRTKGPLVLTAIPTGVTTMLPEVCPAVCPSETKDPPGTPSPELRDLLAALAVLRECVAERLATLAAETEVLDAILERWNRRR